MEINIERFAGKDRLEALGVADWPIWEKEISEFPWFYDTQEICYILEGDVDVIPDNGPPVHFSDGDLITFPAGLSCTWKINKPVRKHYRFG